MLLEHEGEVVGLASPVPSARGGLAALFEELRTAEPLDEDWERDMAIVREAFNRPIELH